MTRLTRLLRVSWILFFPFFSAAPPVSGAETTWQQFEAESADGTRIAYYTAGRERPGTIPLFVISGGPGSDHRYMRVGGAFETLAEKRQVVMFDQRGTSNSGAVRGVPQLASWAEDVEAIRAAVGAEKINILGHSFGGIVAMAYAEKHDEQVNSIVFANSMATSIRDTGNILAEMFPDRIETWRDVRASLSSRFQAREMAVFTSMEFVDLQRMETFLAAIADFTYNIEVNNALRQDMAPLDFSASVQAYQFPVLVLHGRYDPVISPATAWKLHKQIPASEIVIMPATSHLPFAERPEAFVLHVGTFLANAD